MTAREFWKGVVPKAVVALAFVFSAASWAWAEEPAAGTSILEVGSTKGQRIYSKRCSGCHGMEGKGDGPAAERFFPRPRDFTRGLYKYRTTPKDGLPTDADLVKTITNGLAGTGMPAWGKTLSEEDIREVIGYIKTFSSRFAEQKGSVQPISVAANVPSSKESIDKGKELFHGKATCFMCHGQEGRGDGPLAASLKDAWNNPIRPRNLTKGWFFRGGHQREDIYTRINTGLEGTPMPSFADKLTSEEAWGIVNYVYSLSPESRPERKDVIEVKLEKGALPDDPNDPRWNSVQGYKFPLLGQVIRDPRLFSPSIEEVDVKALYNDQAIAILLVWDDTTQSKADPKQEIFDDGFGVQFPAFLQSDRKPYFVRGDAQTPVYLWVWTSDGKLQEMNATGIDSVVPRPAEGQTLKGKVSFQNGQYRLVFTRPLRAEAKNVLPFPIQRFIPIAFSAWDGSRGEGGTRISLSAWYYLYLEVPPPPTLYVYPTILAIVVIGVELWMVRKGKNYRGNGAKPK